MKYCSLTDVIQINENIQQNTGNHITDLLLEDDVDAFTQLVLLNAIYFKGMNIEIVLEILHFYPICQFYSSMEDSF